MLNAQQFYPTPTTIARKLQSALLKDRPSRDCYPVLEPSAGKGDLVSGLDTNKVVCIELDTILQAALKDLKYKVIGDDFLSFNEVGSYKSIIMNPPFCEGIAHLFHAWEILAHGGRMVCLLPTTVLNDGNNQKQRLSQLISLYGSVEDLGKCFEEAERKTSVECVMIVLDKPVRDFGFKPSFDYTVEDFESAIATNTTPVLGKRDVVQDLVHQYELALDALREWHTANEKLKFALTGTERNRWDDNLVLSTDFPTHLAELKARFWQAVFAKTELESRATSDFKKKFTEWQKEQIEMAFTESNIKQMLLMFWQNKEDIDLESLCHVFDYLTRNHANCIVGEGWKTNKASKLNTKVIIEYGVSCDQWGFSINYHRQDDFNDIDKAMCILSSKKFTEIDCINDSIRSFISGVKRGEIDYKQKFSSSFFDIQIFKKGSVHLWFRDYKLNEDFNKRVAAHRKWIGSDY